MKASEKPWVELKKAEEAVKAMSGAENLGDFEEYWKDYLGRLERVWYKIEGYYNKSPKWGGWNGRHAKLRDRDPLLRYLTKARGADEHSVSDISERSGGGVILESPQDDEIHHIRHMSFGPNGLFIDANVPFKITFTPARVFLLPINYRGVEYPVPRKHLGQDIDPNNIEEIAGKGIAFYRKVIEDAENFFASK